MRGYPTWFARFTHWLGTVLLASGLLLAPTTLALRLDWSVGWRLGGDQRIVIAALHALLGFVAFGHCGALWSLHMRVGWRQRTNIASGLTLLALLLLLLLSAIAIYYVSDETVSVTASAVHLLAGISLPLLYLLHRAIGRRFLRRRRWLAQHQTARQAVGGSVRDT